MELTKNKKILYFAIFCIFAITTFLIGINHEPWADEAQAWLIARENSVFDLFFNTLKYEGHPCLWYLILKIFIFLHFPYKYFFVISWGITLFGIYLFLFKIKSPIFIKILFPFTFFIFYQYNIIARDYCLMFPSLCLSVVLYKSRFEKPFLYALSLILLFSINVCTFMTSGILFVYSIIDVFYKKVSVKKYIMPISITVLYAIFTILYLITPQDCFTPAQATFRSFDLKFLYILISGYFNVYKNLFITILQLLSILFVYLKTMQIFCKNKIQVKFFVATNLSVLLLLAILYANRWHVGFLIITFIFSIIWLTHENDIDSFPFKKYSLYYLVVIFLFLLQISWSVKSGIYEINNKYSSGKDVAEFIKQHNYKKDSIEAGGYKVVVVQPYFSENMFKNYPFNKSYWIWSYPSDKYRNNNFKMQADVVIIDNLLYILKDEQKNYLHKYYDEKIYASKIYLKGYVVEDNSLSVYVRKK